MITNQKHTIGPFVNSDSKILVLGSFPSVKSRGTNFFYGNPQNRFWKVLAYCFNRKEPKTIEEKKLLLTDCKIALFDVIESCDIDGSSDSSIRNVVPANIKELIENTEIKRIILNGNKAKDLFYKYNDIKDVEIVSLPSTSPANASWSLDKLIEIWNEKMTAN